MKVLITGGAGYIGSTVASILMDNGITPVLLDSLVVGRREFAQGRVFYEGDIADEALLGRIVHEHPEISHVIHCAALAVVPDSVSNPDGYYENNVVKSMRLFMTLAKLGVRNIVFSSSASLYDRVEGFVVDESAPLKPMSPYARTKYMMEMVLADYCAAYGLRGVALRYFNPIGADPMMRTGAHVREPSHVLGKMVLCANGTIPVFQITGTHWPTRDGSGLRDYFHVWDLARAHLLAVTKFDGLFDGLPGGYRVINLGNGQGVTVFELLAAFEKVYGKKLPVKETEPRPGDVAGACASAKLARELLGWETELSIEQAIADALKWDAMRENIIHY